MLAAIACFFNDVRKTNAISSSMPSNFLALIAVRIARSSFDILKVKDPLRRHGKFDGFTKEGKRKREVPLIIKGHIITIVTVKWYNSVVETNDSGSRMNTKICTHTQIETPTIRYAIAVIG